MKLSDFLQDVGSPVAYYPQLALLLGGVKEAIFLCQMIYWLGKEKTPGLIYKTAKEIKNETGLSYLEQKTARRNLKEMGVLTEEYKRLEHRLYFTIKMEVLDSLWQETYIPECRFPTFGNVQNLHSINNESETTSETTSEKYYGRKSRLATSALSFKEFISKKKDTDPEAVEEIEYFLNAYERYLGKAHPNLKPEQWQNQLYTILECDDEQNRSHLPSSSCIEMMIDRYFQTDFQEGCNYSVIHFNAAGVKSRRLFEVGGDCY